MEEFKIRSLNYINEIFYNDFFNNSQSVLLIIKDGIIFNILLFDNDEKYIDCMERYNSILKKREEEDTAYIELRNSYLLDILLKIKDKKEIKIKFNNKFVLNNCKLQIDEKEDIKEYEKEQRDVRLLIESKYKIKETISHVEIKLTYFELIYNFPTDVKTAKECEIILEKFDVTIEKNRELVSEETFGKNKNKSVKSVKEEYRKQCRKLRRRESMVKKILTD